jgi:hypothetical protein
VSYNEATIAWDVEHIIPDHYVIKYGSDDRFSSELSLSDSDDTIIDLEHLDEDTSYNLVITAFINGSEIETKEFEFHTKLGPPRKLILQYVTNNEALLSWDQPSANVKNYRIIYWKEINSGFAPLDPEHSQSDVTEKTEIFVSNLSKIISNLDTDSDYKFEVSALQSYDGTFTAAVCTKFHTLPNPIVGLKLQKSSFNWIKVKSYIFKNVFENNECKEVF